MCGTIRALQFPYLGMTGGISSGPQSTEPCRTLQTRAEPCRRDRAAKQGQREKRTGITSSIFTAAEHNDLNEYCRPRGGMENSPPGNLEISADPVFRPLPRSVHLPACANSHLTLPCTLAVSGACSAATAGSTAASEQHGAIATLSLLFTLQSMVDLLTAKPEQTQSHGNWQNAAAHGWNPPCRAG